LRPEPVQGKEQVQRRDDGVPGYPRWAVVLLDGAGNPTSRKIQPDGRICYDKDFQRVIGTQNGSNQSWGRVVIDQNTGVVVSQFPASGAGCP
jgi:hypothetical protein